MPPIAGSSGTVESDYIEGKYVTQLKTLDSFKVPWGGQEIELQQVDFVEDGMPLLRVRIREGKRFTIFDIDPLTARRWAEGMQAWAQSLDSDRGEA